MQKYYFESKSRGERSEAKPSRPDEVPRCLKNYVVRTNRIIRRTNIDKGVHEYTKKTLNGVVPNEVVLDTRHNIFVREKSLKNLGM